LLFGKGAPQRDQVDIDEVMNEMIVLLPNETMRYAVSIHTELGPDLPRVAADRVQLQQVFMEPHGQRD